MSDANMLFWLLLICWVVGFVVWLLTAPQQDPWERRVRVPVSPCVNSGHAYRAQPKVYRCVNCGDERTSEDVYDQEHAA